MWLKSQNREQEAEKFRAISNKWFNAGGITASVIFVIGLMILGAVVLDTPGQVLSIFAFLPCLMMLLISVFMWAFCYEAIELFGARRMMSLVRSLEGRNGALFLRGVIVAAVTELVALVALWALMPGNLELTSSAVTWTTCGLTTPVIIMFTFAAAVVHVLARIEERRRTTDDRIT